LKAMSAKREKVLATVAVLATALIIALLLATPVLGVGEEPFLNEGQYYWLVVNTRSYIVTIWDTGSTNQGLHMESAYGSFPNTLIGSTYPWNTLTYFDRAYSIYCTVNEQSFGKENWGPHGHSFGGFICGSRYLCPSSGTADNISVLILGAGEYDPEIGEYVTENVYITAAIYDSDLNLLPNGITKEAYIESIVGYDTYLWVNLDFPAPSFVPRTNLLELLALMTFVAIAVVWHRE